LALRVLKLLEIGAGGKAIGQRAGEFARRLGSCADFRRAILRYVNRRGVRGVGAPFKAIACAAGDRDQNAANDFQFDVHALPLRGCGVHLVVAIGPRQYGFRNEETARMFLREVARVLTIGGELLVLGTYVNPWFNFDLGSRGGRRRVGAIARIAGLRLVNYLMPLGRHPIARVLRQRNKQLVQHRTDGRRLRPPSYLHRFVKAPRRPA